jgi:hypothetical protein
VGGFAHRDGVGHTPHRFHDTLATWIYYNGIINLDREYISILEHVRDYIDSRQELLN